MYALKQTIRFEHDTLGQQDFDENRGEFTDKEVAQELAAYGRAGWHLDTTNVDEDGNSTINMSSGIVELTIELTKVG